MVSEWLNSYGYESTLSTVHLSLKLSLSLSLSLSIPNNEALGMQMVYVMLQLTI